MQKSNYYICYYENGDIDGDIRYRFYFKVEGKEVDCIDLDRANVSKSFADALHFNFKKQNEDKIALGPLYHHDLNLVFCRTDGSPLPKSSLFNAYY